MALLRRLVIGSLNLALLKLHWHLWRIHPRRLVREVESIQISRPIFLLGTQGGGLTLVSRMLRRHPQVVSVTGSSSYWAGPDEMQNVMGSCLPADLTGLHSKVPPHPMFSHRDWLYSTDELLPLYRKISEDFTADATRQFQRAIRLAVAAHANRPRCARLVDKSQSFTVRLSFVNSLIREQNPKFILITRNPYAMCYRAAAVTTPISKLKMPLETKLKLATQHWGNSFRCALHDSRELEDFLVLRFEDILREPRKQLSDICRYAELGYKETMLPAPQHKLPLGSTGSSRGDRKWYPLRPDVNRRYLQALEPWMIKLIEDRVGKLASKWHYSPKGP